MILVTVPATEIARLSREFALVVDADGVVTWADDRAADAVGVAPGARLADLAVPGTAPKLERLLRDSARGGSKDWETLLSVRGASVPVFFCGAPNGGGGAVLVGSVVPRAHSELVEQMTGTVGELSTLYRETERQRRDIAALNKDLAESGRGLRALYTELEDANASLTEAGETKTRFLANASHELRTPINSILGLSQILLGRADGPLTPEQEKQVGFIRQSAQVLGDLVGDLLDLGRADAGKLRVRARPFDVENLFGSLRGMLRPLVSGDDVALVFDEPRGLPVLETDEGKVAQVLRNLISNALKFTERGEVRVSAAVDGDVVRFSVRDTGIGIAPEDQLRVFEEFTQIESERQSKVKGTGLGLALSRKLARALGGDVTLESALGQGSTFTLVVPRVHAEVEVMAGMAARAQEIDPSRAQVLVVEDDAQTLFLYEKYLAGSGFQVVPARSVEDARRALERMHPAAVVLDVMLEGETSWAFLDEMKRSPATRDIPTLVVTVMDREHKARALGADEFYVKPLDREWFLKRLQTMARQAPVERILVIDDDEVARYLVRRLLAGTRYSLLEATDGPEGVEMARAERPDLIVLDFVMPSMTAFEVLDELKCDPKTRNIPVIVSTSKDLDASERRRLAEDTAAVLSKAQLSREVAIARIREALEKAVAGAGVDG